MVKLRYCWRDALGLGDCGRVKDLGGNTGGIAWPVPPLLPQNCIFNVIFTYDCDCDPE